MASQHHPAAPTPSPIGGRSFIDHAKLRILLAPVGGISESDFAKWCDYVRSFETIRLADLPSSCAARRRAATATTASGSSSSSPVLQTGEVHLSFVTSYDPDHAFLAPFNMHRQVLGALGLATYTNNPVHKVELEGAPGALRELHPGALVHRVFGFDSGAKRPETVDLSSIKDVVAARINADKQRPSSPLSQSNTEQDLASAGNDKAETLKAPPSPQTPTLGDSPGFSAHRDGGLIIFPAVRKDGKDVRFYLKTLLSELVATILDGLDSIVTGLEGTPLETPRETLDGITPNRSSSSSSSTSATTGSWLSKTNTAATAAANRASSIFTAFSSSGDSTGFTTPTSSRPSSAIGGGSHPFDLGSGAPKTASPTSENSTRSKILAANFNKKSAKRVTSAAGTGPMGTGRYAKVKADLHLLSGNLWDALENYTAALTALGKERALAGGQDAVWFASALEGFSVARVLVSRMGGIVLEKAPCFDLPWTKDAKDKDKDKDGIARPYAKQSWGEIAEAYTIAIVIYSKCLAPPSVLLEPAKSVTNDSPRDYTHPLIHAGACAQYARFLLAVWASGGWNGECFDQLVYGGVPPSLAEEKPTNAMYLHFTAVSGIARHDIAAAASSALSHSIIALKPTDQITLVSTLTAIFGCIGFSRREAHLLRHLQSTIVGLLVKAKRMNVKPPTTASLPILQQQHFGKDAHELVGNIVAQTTHDSLGRGPEAVLVLAMQICETYGIHVEVDPLRNIPPYHILSKASEELRSAYASPALGGGEECKAAAAAPNAPVALLSRLEMANEAPFGWKEQQIALLKETISIAELLADYVGMAFFSAILLRDFYPLLDAEEQRELMIGMQRSVQSARWAGAQDLAVKYWGPPEPLCSLEVVPLHEDRVTFERDAKLLETQQEGKSKGEEGVAGLNNPFFWNPARAGAGGKGKLVGIQGEKVYVMATLQNPFSVELHIDSVKLIGEGAGFETEEAERVSIPPLSFQTVRLAATAKQVGTTTIKGVALTLAGGCTETESFFLPIYDEENSKLRRKQAAESDDRKVRLKVSGLDARSSVIKQKSGQTHTASTGAEGAKWLTVPIVPAQPLLGAFCAELEPLGGLDIYEGETETVHLELVNLSHTMEVNYVRLVFTDDASEAAKRILADAELLPQDVYEVEWDLVHQPVLSSPSSSSAGAMRDVRIAPGQSSVVPIAVRGKVGCSEAMVTVEYGYVDREHVQSGGKGAGKFSVRKIEVPFGVTVHPVVLVSGLKVAPLRAAEAARLTKECLASSDALSSMWKSSPSASLPRADEAEAEIGEVEAVEVQAEEELDDSEYCLVSLDVSNVHREDILLRLSLNTGGVAPLVFFRVLRAGSTTKVVLPQPRIELNPHTGKPFTPNTIEVEDEDGALFPPIPSIWTEAASRQFIVSKITLSPEEDRQMRRKFWYREALFKCLRGAWRTLPSSQTLSHADSVVEEGVRSGDVILRGVSSGGGLDLDDYALGCLEKDPIKLELTFNHDEGVYAESFTTVVAKVANRLTKRIHHPLIRLVPTSPTAAAEGNDTGLIDSVVVSDGTLAACNKGLEGGLARGLEREVEWGVTFLSPGRFGFLVTVDEVAAKGERVEFVSAVHTVSVAPAV